MKEPTVYDCTLISLPQVGNRSGNITFVNNSHEIPFEIKRIFYLYDIPGGQSRGAHAHKECKQFLIAASGAFEVSLDDGQVQRTVLLNQPYRGLFIPPKIWAAEVNFSSGAICLVLTSESFDENDYIRDYQSFLELKNG